MAISYATSPFSFVDSQFGTAATSTGIKVNVPVIYDLRYHRVVQSKNIWRQKGLLGEDTFSEGNNEQTSPGLPIVRKTNFQGNKGDTLIMHQRTNLATTNNVGKVGGFQIVDSEVGWDLNYIKGKLEQWRQAVRTDGGMNEQRSPFSESFVETEMNLLADWTSSVEDNGITYAAHYGYCPHLFRQYGTTNLAPTACSNKLIGNDETLTTSRTIADITGAGADNIKGITFELADVYCRQNKFDPVRIEGDSYWVVLISPFAALKLLRDADFRNAMQYARERGVDNPLFKHAKFVYGNCLIFEYDKVRELLAGYNPAGLTVSNAGATNSSITEASYTGIGGGVTASQLHHTMVFGANAVGLFEGRMKMGERTENDFQNIIARDADNIWGAQRLDWLTATGAAANNQGFLEIVNTLV